MIQEREVYILAQETRTLYIALRAIQIQLLQGYWWFSQLVNPPLASYT